MRKILCVMAMIGLGAIVSACGGGGGGGGVASTTVNGTSMKGPYVNATVNIYQLTATGARGQLVATTTTDGAGNYSANIPVTATGPFEIVVSGPYVDEITGQVVATPQPTSVVVTDAASAAAGQANVNPVATIQAELAKQKMAQGAPPAVAVQTAGDLALQTFGIPTVDAKGNHVSPAAIDIFNPTDPAIAASVLQVSAAVSSLITQGAVTDVSAFAQAAATDIANGQPLGAPGTATAKAGVTAATVTAASQNVQANLANIASNIANATGTAPGVTATDLQNATVANPTVLRGMAMAGNTFTVGAVIYTVGKNGAATLAPGSPTSTPKNNVVLGFTFKDYTNANGNAASAGTDLTTLNFDIKSTGDKRHIQGTLSPVQVVRDGLGNVSITVPAGATLKYTGTDSTGATVSGVATNIAANVIQANGNVVSIDANALLTTIQNKVKQVNPGNVQLQVLQTAGTFTFDFSVGVNVGHENVAGNGIDQLFPLSATTGGRGVHGTITTY